MFLAAYLLDLLSRMGSFVYFWGQKSGRWLHSTLSCNYSDDRRAFW